VVVVIEIVSQHGPHATSRLMNTSRAEYSFVDYVLWASERRCLCQSKTATDRARYSCRLAPRFSIYDNFRSDITQTYVAPRLDSKTTARYSSRSDWLWLELAWNCASYRFHNNNITYCSLSCLSVSFGLVTHERKHVKMVYNSKMKNRTQFSL